MAGANRFQACYVARRGIGDLNVRNTDGLETVAIRWGCSIGNGKSALMVTARVQFSVETANYFVAS
jgi:hypothetical protein